MKGGKGGRKRKGSPRGGGKPVDPAKAKGAVTKRSPNLPPKKGSRKNTDYGWSSTSGED